MTARDDVESILSERGPATVAEIAEALSNVYTPHTVSVAVANLKKSGTVVLTGDKVQGDRGRPAEVVALNRELERARNKKQAEEILRQADEYVRATSSKWPPVMDFDYPWPKRNPFRVSVWQRVKRLFGVG